MQSQTPSSNTPNHVATRFVNSENVSRTTMSSSEIARLTGKRHDNVKRLIEDLAKSGHVHPQSEDEWSRDKLDRPRATRIYKVCERDSYVVVAQLSPEFTAALVDRWQELESRQPVTLPSYAETLRLYADQIEQTQRVTYERDHAITTKAEIGSRREATAMATASAKSKENVRLRDQLGFSARHATVMKVEAATKRNLGYVDLRRWCKANDVCPEVVPDKRYPDGVKAWPAAAWMAVFSIDIAALFGGEA